MNRLPALGSLRSIANAYDEDDISDEEDLEKSAKKRKLSTEEVEESEQKEDSDYDIVVSDEEENSSGAGSVKNAVAINQPKFTKASRLVSYGGDEDEDDDANKVKPSEIPHNETEATTAADSPMQESEQAIQEKKAEPAKSAEIQPTIATQETQNIEKENEDKKGAVPNELQDHLAAVKSIQVTLPDEPDGRCSNSLQEKIENLLETKRRTGRDLKHTIQRKKNFRNPSIYEKLVAFCSINETGTNYPSHIYDPFSWQTEDSFYERLSKIQKEHHEKKQKERSKVEFVSATKKTGSASIADDAVRKRKSKWDVTSSGTAALTIPPSAVQTIASVQAVVAAASSKLVAVQVKKP